MCHVPYHIFPNQATVLHFAAGFNSSMEVVRVLIEAGADVNALDSDQDSPLHLAAEMNPEIVPALLEAGATVNLLDNNHLSPLFFAAFSDHDSAVAALMAAGADPHLGVSPLTDSDIGEDMKDYIMSLVPLSAQQPEFTHEYDGRIYNISNAVLLHKLLITGQGEQVVSRKGELNRDLLSLACEYWNPKGMTCEFDASWGTVSMVRCKIPCRLGKFS